MKILSFVFGITSALLFIFGFQNCGGQKNSQNLPDQDIVSKASEITPDQDSELVESMVEQIEIQATNTPLLLGNDASSFKQLAQTCFLQSNNQLKIVCLQTVVEQYYALLKRLNYEITKGDRCWLASKRNLETGLARVDSTCFNLNDYDKDSAGLSLGSCVDYSTSLKTRSLAIAYFRKGTAFSKLQLLVPYPDSDPRRIEVLFSGKLGAEMQDACGNTQHVTSYDANFIY